MNIAVMQKAINKTAVEHGWWEAPRTFGSIISLCHSELSESLEEFRAHKSNLYYSDADVAKPEGIAVELVDVVIRILDWAENEGFVIDIYDGITPISSDEFPDFIAERHLDLSMAFKSFRSGYISTCEMSMTHCVSAIISWFSLNEINYTFEEVMQLKMEYNETRPYRHGNKAL